MKYLLLILMIGVAQAEVVKEPSKLSHLEGTFTNKTPVMNFNFYKRKVELREKCESLGIENPENSGCVAVNMTTGNCDIHVLEIDSVKQQKRMADFAEEVIHCLIGQFHD